MAKVCQSWEDLEGLESDHYAIELDSDKCSGWIVPKQESAETSGEHYFEHHKYLSTHTFYREGGCYKRYTELLQKFGFDVILEGW